MDGACMYNKIHTYMHVVAYIVEHVLVEHNFTLATVVAL